MNQNDVVLVFFFFFNNKFQIKKRENLKKKKKKFKGNNKESDSSDGVQWWSSESVSLFWSQLALSSKHFCSVHLSFTVSDTKCEKRWHFGWWCRVGSRIGALILERGGCQCGGGTWRLQWSQCRSCKLFKFSLLAIFSFFMSLCLVAQKMEEEKYYQTFWMLLLCLRCVEFLFNFYEFG